MYKIIRIYLSYFALINDLLKLSLITKLISVLKFSSLRHALYTIVLITYLI